MRRTRIRTAAVVTAVLTGIATAVSAPAGAASDRPWMNTAQSPDARAHELLAAMTVDEELAMVHGTGVGTYVGVVPGNARLGIPAINLEDGPAGVADGMTNVTAFPAPITMAAAWDPDLARRYGAAMGAEERGKGANVHLAPMVNILRVPQGGRNWESLGEDPYLAGRLAAAEVGGQQSEGVIATVKHYADNNQENDRRNVSVQVDERTQHEIYYPAFNAAVRAGAGAVMCSYNKIGGTYACENPGSLGDLKKQMGFRGWVMSDWGATHSTVPAATAGLDQEMPGATYFGAPLATAVQSGQVPRARLDDMVLRILRSMFAVGLFDRTDYGNPAVDVRSDAHTALARQIAEAGTVLLKNAHAALPITKAAKSIAVIGTDAKDKPQAVGGGSGHVIASHVVTPYDGIAARAGSGVDVTYTPGDSAGDAGIAAAVEQAKKSDVAVVFAGITSSEGSDRTDLALPGNLDQLISAVAAANPRTIVVLNTPAQVLMPWVDQVSGVVESWLPGQEMGGAIADVLFGDADPSGRLPMTFGAKAVDYPANTAEQYPGVNHVEQYAEGLNVGYRHFDRAGIAPLFPFGHGLSYTSFRYGKLAVDGHRVDFTVTNTGKRAGTAVPQLYLGFPTSAGEPPKSLKAFTRLNLKPGESRRVTLNLPPGAFQVWDTAHHRWATPKGTYHVYVGASSGDVRLTGTMRVS